MRFIRFAAALMAVVVISGCYHTTVNTGKAPGSQTISDDWHTNWFFGIIPGADVDASFMSECAAADVRLVVARLNVADFINMAADLRQFGETLAAFQTRAIHL